MFRFLNVFLVFLVGEVGGERGVGFCFGVWFWCFCVCFGLLGFFVCFFAGVRGTGGERKNGLQSRKKTQV